MRIKYLSDLHIIGECEPASRTIKYGERFHISFPYMIFVLNYMEDDAHFRVRQFRARQFRVYVSKSPVKNVKTRLGVFPFPNCAADGMMCMFYTPASSPKELLEQTVSRFWSSPFKYYTTTYFGTRTPNSPNSLPNLQKLSKNNPEWWKKHSFDFWGVPITLADFVKEEHRLPES